nr:hypothetical protein [Streptomyces hundungensis]
MGVFERVVEGAEADAEGVCQDLSGAELALVEDCGQEAFGIGDLLPEDAAAGAGLAWSAPMLVVSAYRWGCVNLTADLGC